MAQFDVHAAGDDLLLDCQSDQFDGFDSRVVVPLLAVGTIPIPLEFARLTPRLTVRGEERIMATHLLAAVDRGWLGRAITSLRTERYAIQAALDTLTGSY